MPLGVNLNLAWQECHHRLALCGLLAVPRTTKVSFHRLHPYHAMCARSQVTYNITNMTSEPFTDLTLLIGNPRLKNQTPSAVNTYGHHISYYYAMASHTNTVKD